MRAHLGRRSLVLGAVAGVGVIVLPGTGRSAAARRGSSTAAYAAAAWRPLVGDVLPTSQGPVLLDAITEQHHDDYETFRLRFVASSERTMTDQLVVHHPRHERVTFLVTPSGATGVAVVTRRRS